MVQTVAKFVQTAKVTIPTMSSVGIQNDKTVQLQINPNKATNMLK